ncbi:MAG: outer membrane lipoprotein-sorting protein [Burkholderiales bacterium]|nr:outer membrane lipoprotein-sorting protein [Burkholderiales bacterium]
MKKLLVLLCAVLAWPAFAVDGTQLLKKVDRNLEPESYESLRKLINIEPDGSHQEFVLYSVKKGSDKLVALFLDPPSEQGRSTLRLGENMWLYIPNVGKPVRIASLQSVIGGVFNNADILRLDYAAEYDVQGLTEDKDNYVLALKAKSADVAYDRLKMTVDKKTALPTVIECHAASGMLIKTLRFSDTKDFGGGIRRPATLETDSPLYKGYKSLMLYGQIRARKVPDEAFTLENMARVKELR